VQRRRKRKGPALISESKYARATLANYVENGGPPTRKEDEDEACKLVAIHDGIPF
jgi:hypothetical protein